MQEVADAAWTKGVKRDGWHWIGACSSDGIVEGCFIQTTAQHLRSSVCRTTRWMSLIRASCKRALLKRKDRTMECGKRAGALVDDQTDLE